MNDLNRLKKLAGILSESTCADINQAQEEINYDHDMQEGYTTLPSIDRERYTDLSSEGLEGPFTLKSGKVVYYDPTEGKYYDRDTDMYLSHDEYDQHNIGESAPPGMEDTVLDLKKQYPGNPEKAFATAWSIYNKKHGKTDEAVQVDESFTDNESINSTIKEILRAASDNYMDQDSALVKVSNYLYDAGYGDDDVMSVMGRVEDYLHNEYLRSNPTQPDETELGQDDESEEYFSDDMFTEGDEPDKSHMTNRLDPALINQMASMPLDQARQLAMDMIANTFTTDRKKEYLLRQAETSKSPVALTKLMYDMLLAGEGHRVRGNNNYVAKFGKMKEAEMDEGRHVPLPETLASKLAKQSDSDKWKRHSAEQAPLKQDRTLPDLTWDDIIGKKRQPADEDLNNGYESGETLCGDDYFPDGADGSVVSSTGPSGSRHGDNAMQKSMQIHETYKSLVESYARFLGEQTDAFTIKSAELLGTAPRVTAGRIVFSGPAYVEGKVTVNGKSLEVGFVVNIDATADISEEHSDRPTGYNYGADVPTYTETAGLVVGPAEITRLSMDDSESASVDGQEMSYSNFAKLLGPAALEQILVPSKFASFINTEFQETADSTGI